jgi:hypothetical protein
MSRSTLRASAIALTVPLLALTGCATLQRLGAQDTERVLAAAGFQMRPADTPERLADLNAMPPHKIVSHTKDGNVVYTYADPQNCHCLYVGGPKEYSKYQGLTLDREIAQDYEMGYRVGPTWGPYWW